MKKYPKKKIRTIGFDKSPEMIISNIATNEGISFAEVVRRLCSDALEMTKWKGKGK